MAPTTMAAGPTTSGWLGATTCARSSLLWWQPIASGSAKRPPRASTPCAATTASPSPALRSPDQWGGRSEAEAAVTPAAAPGDDPGSRDVVGHQLPGGDGHGERRSASARPLQPLPTVQVEEPRDLRKPAR